MADWLSFARQIEDVLNCSSRQVPNKHFLEPGNWKTVGNQLTFGLNPSTCLAFQADELTQQTIPLISLLIKKESESRADSIQDPVASFIKKIVSGDPYPELENTAQELGIQQGISYLPVVLHADEADEEWHKILESYFSSEVIGSWLGGYGYFAVPLPRIPLEVEDREAIEELGLGLAELLREEGRSEILLSFVQPVSSVSCWTEAFLEGKKTLEVGRRFHPKSTIHFSWGLPLETLLYDLPEQSVKHFVSKILGTEEAEPFNMELYTTVRVLLEENLNISETARKLFIHRNTLIYRIDRFRADTGRDIRLARDAVLVYLALMLCKRL